MFQLEEAGRWIQTDTRHNVVSKQQSMVRVDVGGKQFETAESNITYRVRDAGAARGSRGVMIVLSPLGRFEEHRSH